MKEIKCPCGRSKWCTDMDMEVTCRHCGATITIKQDKYKPEEEYKPEKEYKHESIINT